MQNLSEVNFKKEFVDNFKGEISDNKQPRQTPGVLYSKATPTPVRAPKLLAWSEELAEELQLAKPLENDINILAGNHVTPTMFPYAACYGGHQFGHWAGQLGDGRAITLGELPTSEGRSVELQLKGAGPTPYSRRADGRAVLRSSVREYLMSEAMFHLGVPTTRALGLVTTGDQVMRDMFYNGNPEYEPGAVVMRVAPSFLRFGNYEILAARKEKENLEKLVSWTIDRYYPHTTGEGEDKVLNWFKEVVEKTAALMVEWLRVGFVHGVMNTDNMSILGLTIDYGPYSFLDDYDPDFTPNTTDLPGRRYAFGKQASIAYWNLGCLASALAPLFANTEQLVAELEAYQDAFWFKYYSMMSRKLGFDELRSDDVPLVTQLEQMLATVKPDMTIFYQLLSEVPLHEEEFDVEKHFEESLYAGLESLQKEELTNFTKNYIERLKANAVSREQSVELMQQTNPRFILRNYLLHESIEELEKGNNSLFEKLRKALKTPYSKEHDEFFRKRPDWASQKAGCSMLSCSS